MGIVILGVDRAFRNYIFVEELSLLFIEGPSDGQILEDSCENAVEV
jgi:hypothetical protein